MIVDLTEKEFYIIKNYIKEMIELFNEKEFYIIKNYIKEMIELFNEKDMLEENECIQLDNNNIKIYKTDLLKLSKKFLLI